MICKTHHIYSIIYEYTSVCKQDTAARLRLSSRASSAPSKPQGIKAPQPRQSLHRGRENATLPKRRKDCYYGEARNSSRRSTDVFGESGRHSLRRRPNTATIRPHLLQSVISCPATPTDSALGHRVAVKTLGSAAFIER